METKSCSDTNVNSKNDKQQMVGRRSSLRRDIKFLDHETLMKLAAKKRNSVSFAPLQFKAAMFKEETLKIKTKEEEEKNTKFKEARKNSIKNEFKYAKELMAKMKQKGMDIEEEDDDNDNDEELKKNTNKNKEIGKKALEQIDSDDESSSSSKSDNEDDNRSKDSKEHEDSKDKN